MRDSISEVGTDYAVFALAGVITLVFILVYFLWVSSNHLIVVEFVASS